MNARRSFLVTLLALLIAAPPGRATTVGLSSGSVNSVYAEQKQSEWCWAACIQMVTNLYGADLTQDEVVARAYGPGVNRAGTLEIITSTLNGSGTTRSGRRYTITSKMLANESLPAALVAELAAGHPVMLGCDTGGSGHAVVCTAVTYQGDASDPVITMLTVRDPWPSDSNRSGSGRQVLSGSDLGPRIMEGWVIHVSVQEANGSNVPAPQGYTFNEPEMTPDTAPDMVADQAPSIHPRQAPVMMPDSRRHAWSDDNDEEKDGNAAIHFARARRHPLAEAAEDVINQIQTILSAR